MNKILNYSEQNDSQKPAINLLRKLGWTYIAPEETIKQRCSLLSNVILEDILAERLNVINSFEYKDREYPFSNSNIQSAINVLKNIPEESLVKTNENIHDLLTLGKSFNETIQGDRKAYTMKFIDWENPENNVYHITDEFVVEGIKEKRRPDIVLFINGIPFIVIENKRRDKNASLSEAISQHIRNQKREEGIPKLYHYAKLLLAVQPNEIRYGAVGTPEKFWAVWKEDNEKEVQKIINSTKHGIKKEEREATIQDKSLLSLCSIERVLEFVYKYLVYDGPNIKVPRYQQYFAVQNTIERVKEIDKTNKRKGGVIWHTTGSGKSLTMVMISKALALDKEIPAPRIIVVTDRIDLDNQIYKTFRNCGKSVEKAKSGSDLIELLQDKGNEIITTIIDKFQTATKNTSFIDNSEDIFVLVDESHRSQYGTAHINMKRVLPNACYIGFTGTPLMKNEKSTARKFGGFIHKYTIDQAVKDGAVLPLLYEGRSAQLSVNKQQIDKGFQRLSNNLNEEAQKDLKKKFASISRIYESEQVVNEIAYDISKHYIQNWQGGVFKAQLAVPRIETAIRYQKYFEEQTDPNLKINTAVVFTPPDSRQDYEDVWKETSNEAKKYWATLMEKYNGKEEYERYIISKFQDEGTEVELIIVVSKLLTGFDAPRNTILYLAKPLHSHNLLQAIARVNRLFSGKEHGHIIDYVGILGKLDEALTSYAAFEDFDEEDLTNTILDVSDEIRKVPVHHANVWDCFKGVYNKKDIEALERHLAYKDLRDDFYEALSLYARTLQTALASNEFYIEFSEVQIEFYKQELKMFVKLRVSLQNRYAEVVSYKEYEPRVKKLLDTYVQADDVIIITKELNIFDKQMVNEAIEEYGKTPASKADFIAHKMKKVITENIEKDEAFYKKFSQLLEDAIKSFQENRISEAEYLKAILNIRDQFEKGYLEDIPETLLNKPEARAFFGVLSEVFENSFGKEIAVKQKDVLANIGIDISKIIEKLIIRDWKKNIDVIKEMENEVEDYLMAHRKSLGVDITFDDLDAILDKCLKVAKNNF
ncbi:MAG: HsdR family type I site-specific deoxyribonuclease [Flavobacterium sp.]|uniref:type I restriction endonuclease subunit R n=1 Tax=Flavobacterium sp. TaxID=239 RepID=UPI0022CAC2D8|nr:HsdR family type I site-specific deoxyribonuclease [Flavobacterium sp.]MCZ8330665.1 HsdR family type I site-specific deoxyribonuclease [Flavobacterium sp.]